MSYVTTVVVFSRYISPETQEALGRGFEQEDGRFVSFGSLSDYSPKEACNTWRHWGGGKGPESDLFGGAFNYLDFEALFKWLNGLDWINDAIVLLAPEEGGMKQWSFAS